MYKKYFIFIVLFVFSFNFVNAKEVDLIVQQEQKVGQDFLVSINIGQLTQPSNAISGSLIYNPDAIEIKKINDGGSVINLWLKNPEVTAKGKVEFAGVTPGGLISGKLFSLELVSNTMGPQTIKLQDLKLVLNDGSGVAYEALGQEAQIDFIEIPSSTQAIIEDKQEKDTTAPLPFEIQLGQDKAIFNNQWFAVFNAYDQDSGIAYYEVAESKENKQDGLKWEKSSSPYLIKDQSKTGYLFVKAVDREGNNQVSVLKLEVKTNILNKSVIYVIILLVIGVIFALVRRFKKQNVKKI